MEDTFQGRWHLMEDDLWKKITIDGGWPSMEDALWWKTTFERRQPLMEDNLWWKTALYGKKPLMEGNFRWNPPLNEGDIWWKTPFDGRQPSKKDNLWGKASFDVTQPLRKDNVYQTLFCVWLFLPPPHFGFLPSSGKPRFQVLLLCLASLFSLNPATHMRNIFFILFYFILFHFISYHPLVDFLLLMNCGMYTNRKWNYEHVSIPPFLLVVHGPMLR